MLRAAQVITATALAVLLTACTSNADEARLSQTPVGINVTAEYNADNLGGAVQWTVTGGAGVIPDDASILVSIAQRGAELSSPGAEESQRTTAFTERVGEAENAAQVVASTNSSSGELAYTMRETDPLAAVQALRVHIALIDDASGDAVAVRSVPVQLINLTPGGESR